MRGKLLLTLLLLGGVAVAYILLDPGQYLSLESLRAQQEALGSFHRENPGTTAAAFFAFYVLVTALSIPGAAVMTLAGGAIFGLVHGTILVSFASSIGATLAFLVARFLLRDLVQARFGAYMDAVNRGIERDGALYLFLLRLVPVFPFFVINLVMALTPMRTVTFYLVSQVGMLAGTVVYVNAGTQLGQVESLGDILSPGLIGAFALLGIFPLLARWTARWIQGRKALRGHRKPRRFDRNLVVIGAGSAGLVTAYIAAAVKAKVTLVERGRMGGDCLNTGCVPSKALIHSARFVHLVGRHREFGVAEASSRHDMAGIMARVGKVISTIEPHDSVERYEGLGVEVLEGEARITGPWTVEVNGETLTTRHIVVATGARPRIPPIPGIDAIGFHTSETLWSISEDPGRLLVLGGGPVGCELAQAFQRLGAHVTLVEMAPRLLSGEDEEVSRFVEERIAREGVRVLTDHRVTTFSDGGERAGPDSRTSGGVAKASHRGNDIELPFDTLLVAVGREARVEGFGLEEVGVTLRDDGSIETDAHLRTRVPTIYACGDCVGPYQFTHAASHQAWHAAVNTLFSNPFKRFRVDYSVLPRVTFADPEVARVGLNESEARDTGVDHEVTTYDMSGQDRAITEGEAVGFVKVLTPPGKDRILGATIVGPRAGEMLTGFTLAMKHGIGLNGILGTIHPYPTLTEAGKAVAGEWKRRTTSERTLSLLRRYHSWTRG